MSLCAACALQTGGLSIGAVPGISEVKVYVQFRFLPSPHPRGSTTGLEWQQALITFNSECENVLNGNTNSFLLSNEVMYKVIYLKKNRYSRNINNTIQNSQMSIIALLN